MDAVSFAERVLQLLDQAAFTATYKYAVLVALLDLVLENTSRAGTPPKSVTTRQLAEKVLALYWPHTRPYAALPAGPAVLRQNRGSQAAILRAIMQFRGPDTASVPRASQAAPEGFERLVRTVEWKLIEMPLPRLQRAAGRLDPFIYQIGWDEGVRRPQVTAYQYGTASAFDPEVRLQPSVPQNLVRLNGVLRPLLHRLWTADVARINGLPESQLEGFLFGTDRPALPLALRTGLQDLQEGLCFYCQEPIQGGGEEGPEVDHFIPWARYPDHGLENLVVAHRRCNNGKRDFLAATEHVHQWLTRFTAGGKADMAAMAGHTGWWSRPGETLGVAASIYLSLPQNMELWVRPGMFEKADAGVLRHAFANVGQ